MNRKYKFFTKITLFLLMSILSAAGLSYAVQGADPVKKPAKCEAQMGDPISFYGCPEVKVGTLRVRFKGGRRPNPSLPLWCDDYEIQSGKESKIVSRCSTGDLGGGKEIEIGGKSYAVGFDVFAGCLGDKVLTGILIQDEEFLDNLWQNKWQRASFHDKLAMTAKLGEPEDFTKLALECRKKTSR